MLLRALDVGFIAQPLAQLAQMPPHHHERTPSEIDRQQLALLFLKWATLRVCLKENFGEIWPPLFIGKTESVNRHRDIEQERTLAGVLEVQNRHQLIV